MMSCRLDRTATVAGLRTPSYGLFLGITIRAKFHRQIHERPHAHACRAFRGPWLDVVLPRCAGDIEMDPRRVSREFPDEHGAHGGAAALAGADILKIRDAALDHLAILIVHGERPHFFASH